MPGLSGVQRIADERDRQRSVEGYDNDHDDAHGGGELAVAACCYAALPWSTMRYRMVTPLAWPWEDRFWKPSPQDRVRELVKAGALIAAEIDRLLRVEE